MPFSCSLYTYSPYYLLTYPSTRTRIWLVETKVSSTLLGKAFVIVSAGLSRLLTYRISYSSRRSYNCRRAIMSIINRFSFVIPSLTRHLYKEYKSVYTIIGTASSSSCSITFAIIELIAYAKSALATILYISDASTLLVTLLLFVLL